MKLEEKLEDRAAEERDRNRKLLEKKFSSIDCHMLPALQPFPDPLILSALGPDGEQGQYLDGIRRLHALVAEQVAAPREVPSTDAQAEPALTGTRIAALMEKMAPAISNGGTFVMSNVEAMEAGAEVAQLKAELAARSSQLAEKDAREQALMTMEVERDAREKELRAELEAMKSRLQTAETPAPPAPPGAGSAVRTAARRTDLDDPDALRPAEPVAVAPCPAPGGAGGGGGDVGEAEVEAKRLELAAFLAGHDPQAAFKVCDPGRLLQPFEQSQLTPRAAPLKPSDAAPTRCSTKTPTASSRPRSCGTS